MTEKVDSVNSLSSPRREHLRTTLIDEGLQALEAEGLEALSLRELARRAGVSPMAPYRHFSDKAALVDALAKRGFAAFRDALMRADVAEPRLALVAWGSVYIDFARERPHLFHLMFRRPPTWQAAGEVNQPGTAYHLFVSRIRSLVGPEEVATAALAAHAFVHGLATLAADRRFRPGEGEPEDLRRALTFFVDRLANTGGG